MKKHILFLGLNDKDSKMQEINTVDAYKITMATIKKYYSGATVQEATGFYTHENGESVIEKSLVISILFAEDEKTARLAEDLKNLFNQESIALQVENVNSKLI